MGKIGLGRRNTGGIERATMPNIFEYQNFRTYLHDYYSEQKALKRGFSYKSFSQKAGISSPSFLFYIISEKRNLTKSTVLKISNAIGLKREEAQYFESLVYFNQAQTIAEKTFYYGKLANVRKPIDIKTIQKDRWEFYSTWYHCVIREVVTFFDFHDNFGRLGAFLIPPISAREAKKSIKLLEQLGFIEKKPHGLYIQTENLIQAQADPTHAFVIERFQIEMLNLVLRAYDLTPIKNRLSLSTTFSISTANLELFKIRLREINTQLMETARIDDNPSVAYQLTLNLIPVSQSFTNETKK
jgi:uncharacterized protein (TIGR02147 family)